MKKIISVFCSLSIFVGVITFGFVAEGSATTVTNMKLAHTRPVQAPMQKDLLKFAARVKALTEGRIDIQIYPGGQLGGSEVVMERVGLGTIEMMLGWPNTALDPRLEVYALTGLCKDFKEAAKVYRANSPFMKKIIHPLYEKQNHKVLASYSTYFGAISFKSEPKNPLDPNAKHNDKLRIPPMNAYRYMVEALGYLTTPLPWGEVFTSLQTGIIDGVGGVGAEPNYLVLRDLIKYYLPVNLYLDNWFLTMNLEQWNALPDSDKTAIAKAASEFETQRFKEAVAEKNYWEKKLAAAGVHVYKITDQQQAEFQKKLKDYAWPKTRIDVGAEFFDKTVKAAQESLKQ